MNRTRTSKNAKRLLVWLLLLTMVFGLLPMAAFADEAGEPVVSEEPVQEPEPSSEPSQEPEEDPMDEPSDEESTDEEPVDEEEEVVVARYTGNDGFLRIFHLDCGRKYFSVSDIEQIIDKLAENNYTHIQLAFGNNGFRFLLGNMEITLDNGTKYTDQQVRNAIISGNNSYSSNKGADASMLSESDMTGIRRLAPLLAERLRAVKPAPEIQAIITKRMTETITLCGHIESQVDCLATNVVLDFAVQYPDHKSPDSFPQTGKTVYFHCSESDTNVVSKDDDGNYYRRIGLIKGIDTTNYEVYMITVTPTSDTVTDQLTDSRTALTTDITIEYNGTEKVAWVDDEANLPANFRGDDVKFHSISGSFNYTVGGEPNVAGLETYQRQGMLVTYYLRAKVTADTLYCNLYHFHHPRIQRVL